MRIHFIFVLKEVRRASHVFKVGYASSLPYQAILVYRKLEAYATYTLEQPRGSEDGYRAKVTRCIILREIFPMESRPSYLRRKRPKLLS